MALTRNVFAGALAITGALAQSPTGTGDLIGYVVEDGTAVTAVHCPTSGNEFTSSGDYVFCNSFDVYTSEVGIDCQDGVWTYTSLGLDGTRDCDGFDCVTLNVFDDPDDDEPRTMIGCEHYIGLRNIVVPDELYITAEGAESLAPTDSENTGPTATVTVVETETETETSSSGGSGSSSGSRSGGSNIATIVGATVGSVVGVAAIIGGFFLGYRMGKKKGPSASPPAGAAAVPAGYASGMPPPGPGMVWGPPPPEGAAYVQPYMVQQPHNPHHSQMPAPHTMASTPVSSYNAEPKPVTSQNQTELGTDPEHNGWATSQPQPQSYEMHTAQGAQR